MITVDLDIAAYEEIREINQEIEDTIMEHVEREHPALNTDDLVVRYVGIDPDGWDVELSERGR